MTAPTTAGQTTTVVTLEQVRELGARTLDEALRNTPGVTIDTRAQGVPRITLRGLPPRETQIFLNGVPLNSAADGQPDPSLIPTENIAEIKVIQGTSSVLYGPGTVAGLVDVITKRGTTGVHSDAGVEIGSGEPAGSLPPSRVASRISITSSAAATPLEMSSCYRAASAARTAISCAPTSSGTSVSSLATGASV
ncbi:TonB-dependent receptor [Methylobacterium sp. P31]